MRQENTPRMVSSGRPHCRDVLVVLWRRWTTQGHLAHPGDRPSSHPTADLPPPLCLDHRSAGRWHIGWGSAFFGWWTALQRHRWWWPIPWTLQLPLRIATVHPASSQSSSHPHKGCLCWCSVHMAPKWNPLFRGSTPNGSACTHRIASRKKKAPRSIKRAVHANTQRGEQTKVSNGGGWNSLTLHHPPPEGMPTKKPHKQEMNYEKRHVEKGGEREYFFSGQENTNLHAAQATMVCEHTHTKKNSTESRVGKRITSRAESGTRTIPCFVGDNSQHTSTHKHTLVRALPMRV